MIELAFNLAPREKGDTYAANVEEQTLEACELIRGDRVEADVVVEDRADGRDVSGERVWGSSVRSPTSTGS